VSEVTAAAQALADRMRRWQRSGRVARVLAYCARTREVAADCADALGKPCAICKAQLYVVGDIERILGGRDV
jgi:hypothetical protein